MSVKQDPLKEQWRIVEGKYPDAKGPNCSQIQQRKGTLYETKAAVTPDGIVRCAGVDALSPLLVGTQFADSVSIGRSGIIITINGTLDLVVPLSAIQIADTETAWHIVGAGGEPAFGTGITNVGSPYPSTRFKKVVGIVHLQIAINRTVGDGSTIFTLPAGYRPDATIAMATGVADNIQRVTVTSAGLVITHHQNVNPLVAVFCFPADQ